MSSLHILAICHLLDVEFLKILPHSLSCFFVWLTVSFVLQKLYSFMRYHLLIVHHSVSTVGIVFRKLSPVSVHSKFSALGLVPVSVCLVLCWGSLTHLNMSFMQDDECESIWIMLHAKIQFSRHHLLKVLSFFFHFVFLNFLYRNQAPKIYVWSLTWFQCSTSVLYY